MKELCKHCDSKLFGKVLLDEKGSVAMDTSDSLEKEFDGTDHYYTCPSCGWENIARDVGGETNNSEITTARPPSNK